MHSSPGGRGVQSGVALITALLVIALATAAAVAMVARQHLDVRRTANTLQRDQAYVYALGAEVMAKEVLGKDDPKTDHMDEDWAKSKVTIPFQGGMLVGAIEDAQARFNVNNLVQGGKRSDADVKRFQNLLEIAREAGKERRANASNDNDPWKDANISDLANAVVDWLDTDSDVSPGGAEDSEYLARERPYRAANAPLAATNELLLVKGFNPGIYADLAPFIVALPMRTRLNVNTVKPEVWRALTEGDCLDKGKIPTHEPPAPAALSGAETVKPKVFSSVDEFMGEVDVRPAACKYVGIKEKQKNSSGAPPPTANPADVEPGDVFAVGSDFFLVNAYAEVGPDDHRSKVKMLSLLQRSQGKVATVTRMQGTEL